MDSSCISFTVLLETIEDRLCVRSINISPSKIALYGMYSYVVLILSCAVYVRVH